MPGPFAPAFTGTTAFSPPVAEKSALEGLASTANNVFSNISTIGKNYVAAQATSKPSYTQIKDERNLSALAALTTRLEEAAQIKGQNSRAGAAIQKSALTEYFLAGGENNAQLKAIQEQYQLPGMVLGKSAEDQHTAALASAPQFNPILATVLVQNERDHKSDPSVPLLSADEARQQALASTQTYLSNKQTVDNIETANAAQWTLMAPAVASMAQQEFGVPVNALKTAIARGDKIDPESLAQLGAQAGIRIAEITAKRGAGVTDDQFEAVIAPYKQMEALVNVLKGKTAAAQAALLSNISTDVNRLPKTPDIQKLALHNSKVIENLAPELDLLAMLPELYATSEERTTWFSKTPEQKKKDEDKVGAGAKFANVPLPDMTPQQRLQYDDLLTNTFAAMDRMFEGGRFVSEKRLGDLFGKGLQSNLSTVANSQPQLAIAMADKALGVLTRQEAVGTAHLTSLGNNRMGLLYWDTRSNSVKISADKVASWFEGRTVGRGMGRPPLTKVQKAEQTIQLTEGLSDALKQFGGDPIALLEDEGRSITNPLVREFLTSDIALDMRNKAGEIRGTIRALEAVTVHRRRLVNQRASFAANEWDGPAIASDNPEAFEGPYPGAGQPSAADTVPTGAFIEDAKAQIKAHEGLRFEAYPDGKSFSVGYGHNGVPEGTKITQQQADAYFEKDFSQKLAAARKAIPKFDDLTDELKIEIVQGFFRGDLSGSPKTLALINQGKFAEASEEFLNNKEYRSPDTTQGVKRRMERISDALALEAGVPVSRPKGQGGILGLGGFPETEGAPLGERAVGKVGSTLGSIVSPANADTVRTDAAQGRLEDQVAQAVTDNPEQFNLENLGTPTGDTPVPQARQGGFDNTPVPQPRPGFDSQGNEVFDGTTGSTPIPRDNLGDISSGSKAGSIVVPPKKKGGTHVTIETTGERKSILESFLPNVSANQYQFVSDLVSNQLGLDPVQKSEDFFSASEIMALKDAVVASRGKSRTKGKIAYANYKTHTDGVWYSEKIGSFDDENLAADYSVKTVLGRANWHVDERGHVIVVDKYDFGDAAKFQKKFKTPFAKLEHLVDVYRNMDNLKLGSYGLLKTIAHLYGSTEDKPGDTFRIDLGPLEDMGQ